MFISVRLVSSFPKGNFVTGHDAKDKFFKDIWGASKDNVVRNILEGIVVQQYEIKDDAKFSNELQKVLDENRVSQYINRISALPRR